MECPQAIETTFDGYRFRSRLEARWAVFFKHLGEPYEFERQGYKLESRCYLPDFWLPRLQCWLEVKGADPTPTEIRLCEELASATGNPVALACGLPGEQLQVYCYDSTDSGGGQMWWDCNWALDEDGVVCFYIPWPNHEFMTLDYKDWNAVRRIPDEISGLLPVKHYHAARRAQFEHGECG